MERWLDDTLKEEDILDVINNDLADGSLQAYPISKDLYKRSGERDRVDIIEPVHYEEIRIEY